MYVKYFLHILNLLYHYMYQLQFLNHLSMNYFHLIQNTIHIDVESTHDYFFLPKSVQSCNG